MRKIANLRTASFRGINRKHITFTHGKGYNVFDTEGNAYIDFILGLGPVIIGHSTPMFNERLVKYLENGLMLPTYSSWHESFVTEYLSGLGRNHSAVLFKTASEAVTAALRLSAMNTRKLGIIRCGYIGWHDAQMANSINWHEEPSSSTRNNVFAKGLHFRGVGASEPVFNWDRGLEQLIRIIEEHEQSIGTFVFDTYQFAYIDLPIVKQAVELCRLKGITVIFDETKTGGRISKYGLAYDYGLDPDLIILGKSLANGAPLSMVVGRNSTMAFADLAGIHGTFNKELFAIYCALITQEIMGEREGYETLRTVCARVVDLINRAAATANISEILHAVQLFDGGMFDIYLKETPEIGTQERGMLPQYMTDQGVLLFQGHPSFVCLEHARLDFNELERKLENGFKEWFRYCRNKTGVGSEYSLGRG